MSESTNKLFKGGKYNWINQPERLVYLGYNWSGNGNWHQFAKVESPEVVWCEVLDSDLGGIEETAGELKTYHIVLEVIAAEGSQTFAVQALNEADALIKFDYGESEIVCTDVEVIDLGPATLRCVEGDHQQKKIEQLKNPWVKFSDDLPDGDYVVHIWFSETHQYDTLESKTDGAWTGRFKSECFAAVMPIPPTGEVSDD